MQIQTRKTAIYIQTRTTAIQIKTRKTAIQVQTRKTAIRLYKTFDTYQFSNLVNEGNISNMTTSKYTLSVFYKSSLTISQILPKWYLENTLFCLLFEMTSNDRKVHIIQLVGFIKRESSAWANYRLRELKRNPTVCGEFLDQWLLYYYRFYLKMHFL